MKLLIGANFEKETLDMARVTFHRSLIFMLVLAMALFAVQPAAASQAITLNGSFVYFFPRQAALAGSTGLCPSGIAFVCQTVQLDGLGAADWTWTDNNTWAPNGDPGCYNGTATFTLTLRSDGSTISGPTTAIYCRKASLTGALHENG